MSNASDHNQPKSLSPIRGEVIATSNEAADHRMSVVIRRRRRFIYGSPGDSRTQAATPRKIGFLYSKVRKATWLCPENR